MLVMGPFCSFFYLVNRLQDNKSIYLVIPMQNTNHGRGTECGPHLQNQGEEDKLYVHRCFGHIQASHPFPERQPKVPQSILLGSETGDQERQCKCIN